MYTKRVIKALYVNRVTSKMGIYDILRVALLLSRGVSLPSSLIVLSFYYVGAVVFNTIITKIDLKSRYLMLLASMLKLIYFIGLLYVKDIIVLSMMSFCLGIAETISATKIDAYCYQINKDNHAKVSANISSTATFSTIVLNIIASLSFQFIWWLPIILMIINQIINFISVYFLPDIARECAYSKTTKRLNSSAMRWLKTELKGKKEVKRIMILLIMYKIFITTVIKIKPYLLYELGYTTTTLGLIDTSAQISALFLMGIPRKYLSLDFFLKTISWVFLVFIFLMPFLHPLFILPLLYVKPVAWALGTPIITQELGMKQINFEDMSKLINIADLCTNIMVVINIYILSYVYKQGFPYYVGYIMCTPYILVILKNIKKKSCNCSKDIVN